MPPRHHPRADRSPLRRPQIVTDAPATSPRVPAPASDRRGPLSFRLTTTNAMATTPNTTTADLRAANGAANGAAPGTAPGQPAPDRPAETPAQRPTAPPVPRRPQTRTLIEAVAALPQEGSGDLTREHLHALAQRGDFDLLLLRCADALDAALNLVEVLHPGLEEAHAPPAALRAGLDALADLVQDRLRRIADLLRGVSDAVASPDAVASSD